MKERWFLMLVVLLAALAASVAWAEDISELKQKAESGDAEAQDQLGRCYATGEGVEQDLTQAFQWHHKAAEQGLPSAHSFTSAAEKARLGPRPTGRGTVRGWETLLPELGEGVEAGFWSRLPRQ